jgi:hypothetical protein
VSISRQRRQVFQCRLAGSAGGRFRVGLMAWKCRIAAIASPLEVQDSGDRVAAMRGPISSRLGAATLVLID